jgi:signal transduction histidine kinase
LLTGTKERAGRKPFAPVEKSNVRYWLVVFLLLSAFATATGLLYMSITDYMSVMDELRVSTFPILQGGNTVIFGLAGLVVLFCLYMLQGQTNLAELRDRLFSEKVKTATLKAQLAELSALFEVGTAINTRLRLDGIIKIIVRRLPNCLGADRASLMIVNPSTGLLECRAAWGYGSDKMQNFKVAVGEGIAGWVAANGRPLLLHGRELGRFIQYAKTDDDISSAMSVPIKLKSVTVGVLNVTRVGLNERFNRQHLRLLCSFAENVAGVIRKAFIYEKVDAKRLLLEESSRDLTSMNQMKEVFLATLSHELKTPLTCIVSFAELLDEQESKLSEGDRKKFISIMHEQSSKLLDLTEQLMDLSKLEKGSLRLDIEETDANEIAHSACVALEPTGKCKGIELRLDLDLELGPIRADATKLRQIMLNLVGNAIKFTEEGGKVVVGTRACGEWVELSVRDTGVGLDSDEISRIFGLFTQGSKPAQGRHHGLGLGLYLVKGFVDLHKGKVTVESEKGKGATFKVFLPKDLDRLQETKLEEIKAEESNPADTEAEETALPSASAMSGD